MRQLRGLGLVSPVQLQTRLPGSQLSLVPKFILLEGDIGESAPRQAAETLSSPSFLSKGCGAAEGLIPGRGWDHAAQTDAAEEAGERRRGKKIRDNVFNLIRSLESLKCILPWTLKFLSWNNQSNRLFAEGSGSRLDASEISGLLKYCPLVLRDGSSFFGNRLSLRAS